MAVRTAREPVLAIAVAGTVVVNVVEFTKVAACQPLMYTVAPGTKFDPVIVKVKADEPTETLEGDKLVIIGAGLLTVNFN